MKNSFDSLNVSMGWWSASLSRSLKREKRSHTINIRKKISALCVYMCVCIYPVLSRIIHTAMFSFWGTKDTSQHNTTGAQYKLSNPLHIPLAALLLFAPLFPFSSFSSFFSSSSLYFCSSSSRLLSSLYSSSSTFFLILFFPFLLYFLLYI